MMDRKLWRASLSANSPRYAQWRAILESDDVPLISPASIPADFGSESMEVHLIDVGQLSELQKARMIAHIAVKYQTEVCLLRNLLKTRETAS